MEIARDGVLIGVIATIAMDAWAALAKHVLGLPTADWALVGRWFGHMPRGVFVHDRVSATAPIRQELVIGWVGHYLIGVIYGLAYLWIVRVGLDSIPSITSALIFGLVTLLFPWFVMQPAMGAGVLAARAPRPGVIRLVNVSMHGVFGASLYLGWQLVR